MIHLIVFLFLAVATTMVKIFMMIMTMVADFSLTVAMIRGRGDVSDMAVGAMAKISLAVAMMMTEKHIFQRSWGQLHSSVHWGAHIVSVCKEGD